MRKGWFGPKRIGWGFAPRTWEGWTVTLVFVAGVVAAVRLAGPASLYTVLPVWLVLFLLVAWATYEAD